jgi:hypothetical protein
VLTLVVPRPLEPRNRTAALPQRRDRQDPVGVKIRCVP